MWEKCGLASEMQTGPHATHLTAPGPRPPAAAAPWALEVPPPPLPVAALPLRNGLDVIRMFSLPGESNPNSMAAPRARARPEPADPSPPHQDPGRSHLAIRGGSVQAAAKHRPPEAA